MNRKSYWGASALLISILIFSTLTFLTSCSSSSSSTKTPPVVTITATSGGGQSAAVGAPFLNPLVATVTTNGTPTSGVTVTFTAPAATDGTFADGGTPAVTDTETTNSSGVATSTVFTAGATAGTYTVTAAATGATTPANFSLTNTAAVVLPLAAGNYVYYVSGEDNNPMGPGGRYFVAGVFNISPSGAITGEQTFLDLFLFGTDNIASATSSIVPGNNGNVLITLDTGDASIGVAGVETLNVSMVSASNGLLTEYDAWASGSGTLDLQTSTAAPAGGYAFFTSGRDGSGVPIAIGGVINVDSAGGISGAGSVFDQNDGGTLSSNELFAPSTVSPPDNFGQVTFDLKPMTPDSTVLEFIMVGYIVDADHIRWIEDGLDDTLLGTTGGTALGQGPKVGTYGTSSLSGSSGVFGAAGFDQPNGPLQTAGLLNFNVDGSVSGNVSFNDFVALTPQGGTALAPETTPCSPGPAVTACYAVDSTGRVTITNVTDSTSAPTFNYNFQLYLAKDGGTVISMDTGAAPNGPDVLAGFGYGQSGAGAFTASSFNGNYVLNVAQQDTNSTTGFEYDGIGAVLADGTSAFTGFLDLNGILTTPLTPTPGAAGGVTGTFPTANANGVFTGTITGIDTVNAATADNFTFYLIGATSGSSVGVIGIENDTTEQLTLGTFELQQ
jgi:hypothetical protein